MATKNKRGKLVFSEKLMYSFINDYKESPCLWDTKSKDYKSVEKRRAALSRLAAKYDVSPEDAKKKINSLRSTYLQEKKKVEVSKKAGGETYEPSLYWFQELEFLYDVIIPRKTQPTAYDSPDSPLRSHTPDHCQNDVSNQEVDQEHLIFEFVPDGNEKTIYAPKLEPSSCSYIPQLSGVSSSTQRPSKRRLVKKLHQPIHLQQFSEHHQNVPDYTEGLPHRIQPHERPSQSPLPSTPADEFDTFCSSIASQLRTLPQADAIEMQLEIQQLVSKRRLAVLKSQHNLSLLRTWESSDGYHHQYAQPSSMGNGNVTEERTEKLVLES